jgi:hypothetical protein
VDLGKILDIVETSASSQTNLLPLSDSFQVSADR